MPMLGDVFINTVYAENPSQSVDVTSHPLEQGADITDHIKPGVKTMDISGVITGPDASMRKLQLERYMVNGDRLLYEYRHRMAPVIIEKFSTTHDAEVKGAFKFSITLRQIKSAQTSVLAQPKQTAPVANKGQQQPAKSTTAPAKIYVVVKGDNLSKIGAKFKVSWQSIYEKNKKVIGSNPNLIKPGMRLTIPS